MKILLVSDEESKYYWDYYKPGMLDDFDLIISCGDLSPNYLQFLVTFSHAPVLYVHGNHDGCYKDTPPDGCINIDNKIFNFNGIKIMGLGGSMSYSKGAFQYSERQMKSRYRKLSRKLFFKKKIDILVTHSPSKGINDGKDLPHQGFNTFIHIMDKLSPKYHFHGHVHKSYGTEFKRFDKYNKTVIVNACEKCIIDYEKTYERNI